MAAEEEVGHSSAVAHDGGVLTTVHIRCSNGSKLTVETTLDVAVGAFKAVLAGRCDVPADQQRLIYKGRILKDDQTLESYGVESEHTLHLVRGVANAGLSANTAVHNQGASTAPNNAASGIARAVPANPNEPSGFGATPFPGLGIGGLNGTGASNPFGIAFPDMEQVQRQLAQNPNLMTELLNMPVVQNLMNNPDLMRNLILNNPQMREIIDRNPEFGHVLNDPSTLRQTLEVARNPELMREMMRNTDRAMSNIESSPEGYNMLRRMYENVQEPFLSATAVARDSGNDPLDSNPFAALLGNPSATRNRTATAASSHTESPNGTPEPNANPLPNPWSNTPGAAQSNNVRSTTSEPSPAGIAGLGADFGSGLGSLPDLSLLNQVLQSPSVLQWMQRVLANPEQLSQVLGMNPYIQNLMGSDPQLRERLQNPEFLQQITNPETMQRLLSFQQLLTSQLLQQPNQGQSQVGDGSDRSLESLIGLFGGLGAGGQGAPNAPNVPLEERYATQLLQLQEMGFFDSQENIRALVATAGNVHAAVDRLLGNPDQ